jgi:hypothetical protein
MRHRSLRLLALACFALIPVARPLAAADKGPELNGKWKLVVEAFGEDQFAIFDLKDEGGKITTQVVDVVPQLGPMLLGNDRKATVTRSGEAVNVEMANGNSFTGATASKEGEKPARIYGIMKFQTREYPARLEMTTAEKVPQLSGSPLNQKLSTAASDRDVKARVKKLETLLDQYRHTAANSRIYASLLQSAHEAEMKAEDVQRHVDAWVASAGRYGATYANEARSRAAAMLSKKPYAKVALALATEVEKTLPAGAPDSLKARAAAQVARTAKLAGDDALASQAESRANALELKVATDAEKALPANATPEQKGAAAAQLAAAARKAGKADVASEAEARAKTIEAQLDEEYPKKNPPLKAETFAGRKDAKADRVVVMELFTGAECPPCVPADVAFDALPETYKTTELIALQYHLHIPGPDPLTNRDSVARSEYYGVGGTPSTYFNGKDMAGGGGRGRMDASRKYGEYRKVIDDALEAKAPAKIDLDAKLVGDEIRIRANAELQDAANGKGKPRLRFALIEEMVRYPGGNGLRFHHHVVRGLPGGVDGKEIANGRGAAEATVNLTELRSAQDGYLDEYQTERPFGHPRPAMDLKHLSVVAFVQDDSDKNILHAVIFPLDGGKKGEAHP